MSMPSSILDEALDYHDRGWCIIPTKPGTKVPAIRSWRRYQSRQPTLRQVKAWFSNNVGIAVILGSASGGLAARDFDHHGAYDRWAHYHPTLARTLPTVATHRGAHVYFRTKTEQYTTFEDGELRADSGHYTILPSSRHPSGSVYRWRGVAPRTAPPLIDPYSEGLAPLPNTVPLPRGQGQLIACVTSAKLPPCKVDFNSDDVRAKINLTLPTGPHQRHDKLFVLARVLKGLPGVVHFSAEALQPIVEAWWHAALPIIRTKEWAETWKSFATAWKNAKYPLGIGNLKGVAELAFQQVPLGPSLFREDDDLKRLTIIACELQCRAGDRPFPLSCRVAGHLLGRSHMQANRLLHRLSHAGILVRTFDGERGRKAEKAAEFRYLGGPR